MQCVVKNNAKVDSVKNNNSDINGIPWGINRTKYPCGGSIVMVKCGEFDQFGAENVLVWLGWVVGACVFYRISSKKGRNG